MFGVLHASVTGRPWIHLFIKEFEGNCDKLKVVELGIVTAADVQLRCKHCCVPRILQKIAMQFTQAVAGNAGHYSLWYTKISASTELASLERTLLLSTRIEKGISESWCAQLCVQL